MIAREPSEERLFGGRARMAGDGSVEADQRCPVIPRRAANVKAEDAGRSGRSAQAMRPRSRLERERPPGATPTVAAPSRPADRRPGPTWDPRSAGRTRGPPARRCATRPQHENAPGRTTGLPPMPPRTRRTRPPEPAGRRQSGSIRHSLATSVDWLASQAPSRRRSRPGSIGSESDCDSSSALFARRRRGRWSIGPGTPPVLKWL